MFEYLDEAKFRHFLYERDKPYDGVLQKFVDPMGDANTVYRVIWSPTVTLFEKRENKKSLYDRRLNMYERALTYEGKEYFSRIMPVKGQKVISKLLQAANNIVQHVVNVTYN